MEKKDLLKNLNLSTFVAFDFETTGLDPYHDKIIEIAAIRFDDGEISDRFVTLINQDGENVTLEMNEELNEGIKLVDMNQKEAIFLVEESDSYLIMNFKNEIKETSEY